MVEKQAGSWLRLSPLPLVHMLTLALTLTLAHTPTLAHTHTAALSWHVDMTQLKQKQLLEDNEVTCLVHPVGGTNIMAHGSLLATHT